MVDPELAALVREQLVEAVHRGHRPPAAGVHRRNAALLPSAGFPRRSYRSTPRWRRALNWPTPSADGPWRGHLLGTVPGFSTRAPGSQCHYALIFDPHRWPVIRPARAPAFRGWRYLASAPGEATHRRDVPGADAPPAPPSHCPLTPGEHSPTDYISFSPPTVTALFPELRRIRAFDG